MPEEPLDAAGLGAEEEEVTTSPLITPPSDPVPFAGYSNGLNFRSFESEEEGSPPQELSNEASLTEPPPQYYPTADFHEDGENEDDPSYLMDAGRGVVYGGLGFVESLAWLGGSAGNTAIEIAERVGLNEEGGFRFGELDINGNWEPETWLGHAIGGITQVAAGYALTAATLGLAAPAAVAAAASGGAAGLRGAAALSRYGRFLKWAAFSDNVSKLGKITIPWGRARRGMTIGAVADFISFKENEERLSNLIRDWPTLGITEFLAADKDDHWFVGRMKNSLEGTGLGLIAEFALLPLVRNQKEIIKKLEQGKFDEAMAIQRKAGPSFLENLTEIRNGEAVLVLHNEDVLRQYLTLLPDMDPSKMSAAVAMMQTAARLHQFDSLNSFLQQGMRTSTLNMGLPAGALEDLDPSLFGDAIQLGLGNKGVLGNGTPYAMFGSKTHRNILTTLKNATNDDGSPKWNVIRHTRYGKTLPSGKVGDEIIYIVPGMSIDEAQQIAVRYKNQSFISHKGVHQNAPIEGQGIGLRWQIQPLKRDKTTGMTSGVKVYKAETTKKVVLDSEKLYRTGQEVEDFGPSSFQVGDKRGFVKGQPFDASDGFAIEMKPTPIKTEVDRGQDAIKGVEFSTDKINPDNVTRIFYNSEDWVGGNPEGLARMEAKFPKAEVVEVRLNDAEDGWVAVTPKTGDGEYGFKHADGTETRYDLEYEDKLQEMIPATPKDDLIFAQKYPETVAGRGVGDEYKRGWGDRVDTKRTHTRLTKKRGTRPGGDLPKGTLEKEFTNLNDVLRAFEGVSMNDVSDAMKLLGDTPPAYLNNVTTFLERQKSRAVNGKMTVRDVMKAALMTVGSQQSSARSWAQRGTKAGTRSSEGIKWRILDSMKFGVRKIQRDEKGKQIGRMRREQGSKVSTDKMRRQFNDYKLKQGKKGRSDKFITFVNWLEKTPSKGASWRGGGDVGGSRAFEKSKHKGQGAGAATDMVRPEEYVGLWLMSPNGRMALDALEKDEILTELWEELRHVRAAMGSDTLSNTNLLPKVLRKIRGGKGSAERMAGETTKLNIAELKKVTQRFNNHLTGRDAEGLPIEGAIKGDWNTEVIGNLFKEVSGVSDAKEGFMKHYLGIGDTATIDSAQLRYWLTGLLKAERGAKGSIEEMHRVLYSAANKLMKGENRKKFVDRVRKQNEKLLEEMRLVKDDNGKTPNANLTAHVLHHWLWDKVMKAESLTDSARTAMTMAQTGPQGVIKGAVTFANDGESILHLFTTSFSDRYGRTYEASDFGTLIHEVSHIYRRAMKDPLALKRKLEGQEVKGFKAGPSHVHDMQEIETHLGVKDGIWETVHEEKFAEMFESWIMRGGDIPEGLEREFKNMRGWMHELYRNVHNSPMKHNITPEIKGFFSRIFGKEGLPTFLTPKDHESLNRVFMEKIEDGVGLENSLTEVGLNLRLWSNESEAEDLLQGLVKWLSDKKDGNNILVKYKALIGNPEAKKKIRELTARSSDWREMLKKWPKLAKPWVQENAETLRLATNMADMLGTNENSLRQALMQNIDPKDLPEHLVAGKILMDGYSKSIYMMAEKVAAGEGGEMAAATLKILQQKFVDVYGSVMKIQRGAARTVQAGNIPIQGLDPDQVYQIVMNSGGMGKVKKFAQDIITGAVKPGQANLKQLRQQSRNQLFWDVTHEWRVNALLSSLKSLTIDLTSTTMHAILLPAERMVGGFLMGNRELIKEGASLYYGYASALKEAMTLGNKGSMENSGTATWNAFKREQQRLDPMVRTSETAQNAWSRGRIQQVFPEARGWKPAGILAGFFHYAGFWVRWPSRFRIGSKEMFDQVSYRARFREILMKQALDKFSPIEPLKGAADVRDIKTLRKARTDNIAKYVVDNFESGFDAMGRGINKDALQYAREVNFSEPLTDGLGALMSTGKYRLPGLGLLVPFVRTPTWLIRGFIGRSFGGAALLPVIGDMVATLNPALKAIRSDFLAGGAKRSRAIGKVTSGTAAYGAAVVFAYEGASLGDGRRARIIGSGPPDPAQRKIWESGGKKANSVEITEANGDKKYIVFDRLDPFWMPFGMAADYVQIAEFLTDDQKEDVASFVILNIANRLDGAYMKGAMDFAGAWSQGGGKLDHFLANMDKSFLPRVVEHNPLSAFAKVPGLEGLDDMPLLGNFFKNDPYRRERESFLRAWETVWPSLFDTYGVKYDTITGKPLKDPDSWLPFAGGGDKETFWGAVRGEISPFLYSESRATDNPMAEVAELLYGFGPPSPTKSFGKQDLDLRDIKVDYKDSEGVRVKNMYQAWQNEIGQLDVEKHLNRLTKSFSWKNASRDTRIAQVSHTIRSLREMALGNMLKDMPIMKKLLIQARINRHKAKLKTKMSQGLSG